MSDYAEWWPMTDEELARDAERRLESDEMTARGEALERLASIWSVVRKDGESDQYLRERMLRVAHGKA